MLKILSYTYDVVLSVSGSRTALNMAVSDGSGAELDDMVVGEGVNVALENPRNSSLNLTQKYDGDRQVLAMEVCRSGWESALYAFYRDYNFSGNIIAYS